MPCSDVVGYERFGGPYYAHLQEIKKLTMWQAW